MTKVEMDHLLNNSLKKENIEYAINRNNNAQYLLNTVMDSISAFEGVDVIPFNEFKPLKTKPLERFMSSKFRRYKRKSYFYWRLFNKRIKLPSLKK